MKQTPRSEDAQALLESLALPDDRDLEMSQTMTNPFSGGDISQSTTPEASSTPPPLEASSSEVPADRASSLPPIALDRHEGSRDIAAPASGEFSILRTLGEGGMGLVQEAYQRSLKRHVAIKQLRTGVTSDKASQLLLQEARITGSLEHPNIIPIHALGRDQRQRPILVMKRVDGVVWGDLLHDPAHEAWSLWPRLSGDPLVRHLEVLMALCNALDFAHSKGIIHRDLKPDNVMLGEFGEVYLLDWGIATPLPEEACAVDLRKATSQMGGGKLVGTPAYMAPEMLLGQTRCIDIRTDVYLLGAILHELLVGVPLHSGSTLREIVYTLFEEPERDYPPTTPQELIGICERATAMDPEARYPNAAAFRAAIEDFLQHRSSTQLSQQSQEILVALERLLAQETSSAASADSDDSSDEAAPDTAESTDARELSDAILQHYSEARFGFQMALRDWPENPQAIAGLECTLGLLFHRSLQQKDASFAATLLQQHPSPPAEWREALDALEREKQQTRQETKALQKMAWELDLDFTKEAQRRLFWVMLILSLVPLSLQLTAQQIRLPTHGQLLGMILFFASATSVVLFLGRKSLTQNKISRQFVLLIISTMVIVVGYRFTHFWLKTRLLDSMIGELYLMAIAFAAGGVFLRRWLFYSAILTVGSGIISAFYPAITMTLIGVSYVSVWLFALLFDTKSASA